MFKKFVLPRLLQYIAVLVIGITVVFIIPRLLPADPVQSQLSQMTSRGQYMDPAALSDIKGTLKELYGLEGGMFEQYVSYIRRLFQGDFGPSFLRYPTPVWELITNSLPWTVGLMGTTMIITWIIGTILGGISAYYSESRVARIIEFCAMFFRPIPAYISALLFLILFTYVFPIFPMAGGYGQGHTVGFNLPFILDVLRHSVLPLLSLVVVWIGHWYIQMRNTATNIVEEGFVTHAELSGLSKVKIIFKYIIRVGMTPLVTGFGLSLGWVFGGALITEIVFAYPGIGTLLYEAIQNGDYNLIIGINIFSIFAVATAMLLVDFIYPFLDPRIRYE
ncbi:MAG: ABC transporter permease [Halothermotrichaceae bacterium]